MSSIQYHLQPDEDWQDYETDQNISATENDLDIDAEKSASNSKVLPSEDTDTRLPETRPSVNGNRANSSRKVPRRSSSFTLKGKRSNGRMPKRGGSSAVSAASSTDATNTPTKGMKSVYRQYLSFNSNNKGDRGKESPGSAENASKKSRAEGHVDTDIDVRESAAASSTPSLQSVVQNGTATGTGSPIRAVFNREYRKMHKNRSNSDTTALTMSRMNHLNLPSQSANEIAETDEDPEGPLSPATPLSGLTSTDPERATFLSQNGQINAAGGPSRPAFRRRLSQFNTSDTFSRTFNFKNPWRRTLTSKKVRKEQINPKDFQVSSELIKELSAGTPAAIILASQFQTDDRHMRRVPVLIEQIRIEMSYAAESEEHHHLIRSHDKRTMINMELRYGSGPAKLTWSVKKTHRDFIYLNTRLKAAVFKANPFAEANRLHLPQLPKPYLRPRSRSRNAGHTSRMANFAASLRSRSSISSMTDEDEEQCQTVDNAVEQLSEGQENPNSGASARHSISGRGRAAVSNLTKSNNKKHRDVNPEYLKEMEEYMKSVLQIFLFRADVNRLLQFLELSNMSIRLAPEHSYHGKQGNLLIQSSAATQGWQVSHWKPTDLPKMIARHTNKWFMVRHSYIAAVDNITSTNLLEVFMVDQFFKVTQLNTLTGDGGHSDDGGANDDGASILSPQPSHVGNEHAAAKNGDRGDREADEGGRMRSLRSSMMIENNERKLKLGAMSEKEIAKWCASIHEMMKKSPWSQKHRFDSFAPVRQNVHCQWLVDGRDYFWTLSEAIDQAKDVIYIHDWWLSPELYLRRPPQGNQQWRLDRLLMRKAEEGVKIFIILYRNVGTTIPIDSLYSKYSLLDLHPNIYAMRSPNPLVLGTLFWAHHEKICLIDHTIGFIGGIDLCYGRYDTPDHVLSDDAPQAFFMGNETDEDLLQKTQIWPGKDYSNARVQDFHNLDRPFEDMYDRKKVPRMPWHDIHMMVVGQPVRDLSRHFVQRWNYLIRQKRPSRATPLLLPPPDLSDEEIRRMDLRGTCEFQVLRSSGSWSLGLKNTEHSIQNAYLKAIETSEHFIYIENQFFITSTVVEGTVIENKIGDALVERIIRAHDKGENWRAVIIIPLMPGFESEIDLPAASSVRLIMMCQYFSISRGPNSIFGRLEQHGIDPDDYIQFFSLRKWAKIGPNNKLVTEQLYIHAKILIADDRLAIIGSANINERSQRGSRDSELAAIVRDTQQVESRMGGKPYMVGIFAHSMRVRLMREHLGIDVDKVDAIDHEIIHMQAKEANIRPSSPVHLDRPLSPEQNGTSTGDSRDPTEQDSQAAAHDPVSSRDYIPTEELELHSFNHFSGVDNHGFKERKNISIDSRIQGNKTHREDILGYGPDAMSNLPNVSRRLNKLKHQQASEEKERNRAEAARGKYGPNSDIGDVIQFVWSQNNDIEDVSEFKRQVYDIVTGRNVDEYEKMSNDGNFETQNEDGPRTEQPRRSGQPDPYGFDDPLDESFYLDVWCQIAVKNTEMFRRVFRCQPDDAVTTWKAYKDFVSYGEKFSNSQDQASFQPLSSASDTRQALAPFGAPPEDEEKQEENESPDRHLSSQPTSGTLNGSTTNTSQQRRRRRTNTMRSMGNGLSSEVLDQSVAETMLQEITGHLVWFPTNWLSTEFDLGNWWFNFDRIPPLDIYD